MGHKDTADVPEWLDDDFLKLCLRNSKNLSPETKIEIKELVLTYVVPKGENYMSVMYRANVKYNLSDKHSLLGEESLIVKVGHENGDMVKLTDAVFNKESLMYTKVLPDLSEILENKGIDGKLVCRCHHTNNESIPRVLVLEDLQTRGYVVADRRKGLDLAHSKLIFKKLAKLHAASMVYWNNLDDDTKSILRKSAFQPDESDSNEVHDEGFIIATKKRAQGICEELAKYEGYETAIEFFTIYVEKADQLKSSMDPFVEGNKFNALIHSDCWTNNVMFKYSKDGAVEDVLLIDLQMSHYSSVCMDILYFFFSSTDIDVRRNHFDELLQYYLDALVSNLRTLAFDGELPTMNELRVELKRNILLVGMVFTILLPLIMIDLNKSSQSREESKAFSMGEVMEMITASDTSKYNEVVRVSVDLLQRQGILKFPELIIKERQTGE